MNPDDENYPDAVGSRILLATLVLVAVFWAGFYLVIRRIFGV